MKGSSIRYRCAKTRWPAWFGRLLVISGLIVPVFPAHAQDHRQPLAASYAPHVATVAVRDDQAWQREPAALKARAQWRFGTAALVSGVILGAGAVVLGSLSPCAKHTGNSCFKDAKARALFTLSIPAGILIAAGTTSVIVGGTRWKRLRARGQSH